MSIEEIIKIINDEYDLMNNDKKIELTYRDAELTFTNGYCYDYHLLLKRFYPAAKLMMQNDKMHCATLIDDVIYDVTGIREDKENFHEATGCDLEYIFKYYGTLPYTLKTELTCKLCKKIYPIRNKQVNLCYCILNK